MLLTAHFTLDLFVQRSTRTRFGGLRTFNHVSRSVHCINMYYNTRPTLYWINVVD